MNIVVFVVWGVLLEVKAEIRTIVAILRTFPRFIIQIHLKSETQEVDIWDLIMSAVFWDQKCLWSSFTSKRTITCITAMH